MHPIEYLRYLARADDAPTEWLIPEAADALRGLIGDHQALVTGCRKLLEHHALRGPMWWLCGHVLVARDPWAVIDDLVDTFVSDPTRLHLSLALADVDLDTPAAPRVLDATLAAPAGVVVADVGSTWSSRAGTDDETRPIWIVAGVGTVVPGEIFATVVEGASSHDRHRRFEMLDTASIVRVIRADGISGAEALRAGPDVSFIPELLARG